MEICACLKMNTVACKFKATKFCFLWDRIFWIFIISWQHSHKCTVYIYISVCNILGNVLQCFTKTIKNLGKALVLFGT